MDVAQRLFRVECWGRQLRAIQARSLMLGAALAVTVAVALGLRLYGLDWDRGYSYTPHPDERAILMHVAGLSPPALGDLRLLLSADESPWNPRWFPYGSFPLYLLKGVQLGYSTWPGAELDDLRLAGRAISAAADVATVLIVFLLGSRVYGHREALLASALVAMAVIHVQLSHFYTVDTLLALFTVASLYFMYRVARTGRLKDSLLAGTFVGLGLATKLSQAPIYIAFVMSHLFFVFGAIGGHGVADRTRGVRARAAAKGLFAGILASGGVFLVVQPYALLDWTRFYSDFVEQAEMVRRIRDYPYTRQYIDTTPYWYHIRQFAAWGLGWPLGVVAWVGLVCAALRGTRLRYGLAYVVAGWVVPMGILLLSTSMVAIIAASVFAFTAILASVPYRSPGTRGDLLLLSWVVPYFLITGALEVKFLRYLIPIAPFLLLFASKMMFSLWDRTSLSRPNLRPLLVAGFVFLIAGTGAYALSYMEVYSEPHTGVRMSQWINQHAREGSVILKEHWEEGLPQVEPYVVREMPLYEPDTPEKLGQVAGMLAEADYIAFFSNRLYGSIPRLPERYPYTQQYYRLLFSGELGYELANVETAYPRLAGVSLVDDTLGRPGLANPSLIESLQPLGPKLNLGFADESFSVYDHPTGLLFRNVARFDSETITGKINNAAGSASPQPETVKSIEPLLFSLEDAVAQQEGGTWTHIVSDGGWTRRLPVLAWLSVLEGIALLAWPLAFILFRSLADRGYLFSKALGLLTVSLIVWLLASVQWMALSRASIGLALLLLAVASLVAVMRSGKEMTTFLRERWRIVAVGETVFLLAFFSFVLVRMANPDLWHPYLGGEKPMDMAYLNAVLKSSYMPPYDPWFAGGYMNYYYWGQFVVATLLHATGIAPTVAYNLAVPMFFALTAAGSFSIVYNLAEASSRRMGSGKLARRSGGSAQWSPAAAGVLGALFTTVLGNLDGAIQMGQGIWRTAVLDMPFGSFDFWRSSRMMSPGNEITEFPFFTFLFADLHAHMMVIPFTLLALGLALAVVLGVTSRSGRANAETLWAVMSCWGSGGIVRLAVLGVAVGALRLINAWDFPIYLIIAVAAVFIAVYFRHGGLDLMMLIESGLGAVVVVSTGYLAFLPFHLSYEAPFDTPFGLLSATTNQTELWQFLSIAGLFVFIVGSFFVVESKSWLLAPWRAVWASASGREAVIPLEGAKRVVSVRAWVALLAAVLVGGVVYGVISTWTGSTIPFLVFLLALVFTAGTRSLRTWHADAPQIAFVVVMVGVSLVLAIGLDIFRVAGDLGRMNSVFKFYLQIWVLLALASAYLLWRMWNSGWLKPARRGVGRRIWLGLLSTLLISASIYPVLGTRERLGNRFNVLPLTLDGTAYVHNAVYQDANGQIDLSADYEGITWLQKNVAGSPVILEGVAPQYRWGSRISVYTGLPTVVGWKWHQEQQRWNYRDAVGQRVEDVGRMYSTTNALEAVSLMGKYGVAYVYIGQLERLYYPAEGLAKFEGELSDHMEAVYRSEDVIIYRVR